jgi:hypothetical protein
VNRFTSAGSAATDISGAATNRSEERMNCATVASALLLPLMLSVGAGLAWGQSGPPVVQHRRVLHDTDTRVGWFANYQRDDNGNCSARFIPTLNIVTPPAHGLVQFVTESRVLPRTGCNNPFYGMAVMYRPSPGFVGEDQFTITRPDDPMAMIHVGRGGLTNTFVIRVVGTAPGADATPASRQ